MIDISRPLGSHTPVWPGDAPFRLCWTLRQEAGAAANVGEISMTTHCGTHVDAPLHVTADGAPVGALAPEVFVGPARVVEVRGVREIGCAHIEAALGGGRVPERLLFHTGCWTDARVLPAVFPAIAPAAAEYLRAEGLRLVGTDAPSVDPPDSEDLPAHRAFAGAGIPILENLFLDAAAAGDYHLVALPLRLDGADASPVRAVLIR
ncbi:MAG TPA: cyclase family protein [Longimicrobiaceae bacterium]|nr:cyclase family protein [Longimicrobiaceae bacterium]